jgi:phosphate transport system substrate-binding protein
MKIFASFFWLSTYCLFATPPQRVSMAGGTAHIPVMAEAASILAKENIQLEVSAGGSGVGISKAGSGLVHIGNSGRPLTPEEKTRLGLEEHRFALDGIAIIVHPRNPLKNLTEKEAQAIFSGERSTWIPFNAASPKITLYTREEASGTRQTFKEGVMQSIPFAPHAHVLTSNGAMKLAISRDPNGIGFCSIGHVDASVKALAFSGVEATQALAASGAYSLVRPLLMVTKSNPSPEVKRVLTLIQSPGFASHIQAHGYLPLVTP